VPSRAFVNVVGICCSAPSANNNSLCDFLTIASRRPGRSFSYFISYLCSTGETTRNSRQSRPNNLLVTTFMLCFPFRVRLSISKKERNVKWYIQNQPKTNPKHNPPEDPDPSTVGHVSTPTQSKCTTPHLKILTWPAPDRHPSTPPQQPERLRRPCPQRSPLAV
jgi:hypothetical protein